MDGLKKIDITSGVNGYPENIYNGFIGFSSYAEAEEFAEVNGGVVSCFHKKQGWGYYENKGHQKRVFYVGDYLDKKLGNYYKVVCVEHLISYFKDKIEKIKPENFKNFLIDNISIFDKIEEANDDQTVICYAGRYHETVYNEFMSYDEDNSTYVIGVTSYNREDDKEELEEEK